MSKDMYEYMALCRLVNFIYFYIKHFIYTLSLFIMLTNLPVDKIYSLKKLECNDVTPAKWDVFFTTAFSIRESYIFKIPSSPPKTKFESNKHLF